MSHAEDIKIFISAHTCKVAVLAVGSDGDEYENKPVVGLTGALLCLRRMQ